MLVATKNYLQVGARSGRLPSASLEYIMMMTEFEDPLSPRLVEGVSRVAGADDSAEVCGTLLFTESELLTARILTVRNTSSH